jgi:hypothetical protein
MTDININPTAIEAASSRLAGAKTGRDQAAAEHQKAAASRQEVVDSLAKLQADRAQIMQARAAGKHAVDHGPRLALIAADGELLEAELSKREAALSHATAVLADANAHVARCEQALQHETNVAAYNALHARVTEIDALYGKAIAELQATSKRLGQNRFKWAPSVATADLVRLLDGQRGDGARGLGRSWS